MSSLRILICEDGGLSAFRLSTSLRRMGHEVVGTAADGEVAVTEALRLLPDVVLMDIGLPKKDGLHALQEIMQHSPTAIVMVTGHTAAEFAAAAFTRGAVGFLCKPFTDPQLTAILQAAWERFTHIRAAEAGVQDYSDPLLPTPLEGAEESAAEKRTDFPEVGHKGGSWGVVHLKALLAPDQGEPLAVRVGATCEWSRLVRQSAQYVRAEAQYIRRRARVCVALSSSRRRARLG